MSKEHSQHTFTTKRKLVLFSICLGVKILMVLFLSHLSDGCKFQNFYSYTGDADSYIEPHENLLKEGTYFFQPKINKEKILAGRMPYYGIPYYLLRQAASREVTLNFIVFFQIALECIAILLIALLAYRITSKKNSFYLALALLTFSTWYTSWSTKIAPESLSISFLVISLYYYYLFLKKDNTFFIAISSISLTLVICLKPYLCLLLPPLYLHFLWIKKPKTIKLILKPVAWSALFLLLFIGPWVIRNYLQTERFIPFQQDMYAGYDYSPTYLAYRDFVGAWGGSTMFWDKRSAGCYFRPSQFPCEFILPEYSLAKSYGRKEVESIRKDFIEWQNNPSDSLEKSLFVQFSELKEKYKTEQPFQFHFLSRIRLLKTFIFHSGSYFLPIDKNSACYSTYQSAFKYLQSILYYFVVLFGFVGMIMLSVKQKAASFLLVVPVVIIFLFPFILRSAEFRYFNHAYPILVIGATYLLGLFIARFKENKVG